MPDEPPIVRCCWCGEDIRLDVGNKPCRKIHEPILDEEVPQHSDGGETTSDRPAHHGPLAACMAVDDDEGKGRDG